MYRVLLDDIAVLERTDEQVASIRAGALAYQAADKYKAQVRQDRAIHKIDEWVGLEIGQRKEITVGKWKITVEREGTA